jgi:tetratricopeptide (TPR) repeat protein
MCQVSYASTGAEKAEELFMQEKYDKAITEAQKAIDADSGKKYELYYLKGLSELKLNKFNDSRRTFEYILEKYPKCTRAFDAYIGIGDAYLLEGNSTGALRAYKSAADEFGDSKNAVVARQRINDCMAKAGVRPTIPITAPEPSLPAKVMMEPKKKAANFTPKSRARTATARQEEAQVPAAITRSGNFSVQVGSFKSRSNAERLKSKLSAKRYDARIESPTAASEGLYRVKVGRLSSGSEAERLAAKLKREGYPTRVCQED